MNKILLSTITILTSISLNAQNFTQANEPVIGETKSMFLCDSFANTYAATVGTGVTWNYNNLPTFAGQNKIMEVIAPSTTPFATDYPVSTAATRIQNFTYTFINSNSTERSSDGYVLENTDIGDVKAKFTSDDQLLMNYPSSLGASVTDSFAGNLSFTYSGIPQNPSCTGVSYAIYEGFGTLIQPNGTTLTNISRYHFADTLWTTIPIIGAAQIIRSQYEYYDLTATNHLPVFMIISAKLVSGFPDPLIDATVVLSAVSGPTNIGLNENLIDQLKVYPNPAQNQLTIENISENAHVTLSDLAGRKMQISKQSNGTFNLNNVSPGVYVLNVVSNEKSYSQTLVVE